MKLFSMAMAVALTLLFLLAFAAVPHLALRIRGPGLETQRLVCNATKASPGDPFPKKVSHCVNLLIIDTPGSKSMKAEVRETGVYAAASCRSSLTLDACCGCLSRLGKNLLSFCGNALGGDGSRLVDGCIIRYETFDFS